MKVYLDANCIIYLVENHPVWCPKVVARITSFRSSHDELTVGDLSRAECLVVPFKRGDVGLEARYQAFFSDPDIPMVGMNCNWLPRSDWLAGLVAKQFGRRLLERHLGHNVRDPSRATGLATMVRDGYRYEGSMYAF